MIAIEEKVLGLFLSMKYDLGNVINFGIIQNFSNKLNPKERNELIPAINSLIDKGYISSPDERSIRLEQLGYDNIYPCSDDQYLENVKQYVFNKLRRANINLNCPYHLRNFGNNLHTDLNPKERKLFEQAINSMISDEYISYRKEPLESIILEQKGFDFIY